MSTMTRRAGRAIAGAALFLLCAEHESAAAPKDECVEAHGRGQDQRDRGQLAAARQTFLTCAQPTCPQLVQADCARFSEELSRLVPTVTFSARDANANDLPDTSVYVDGTLMTTRLDDGRSFELDPGRYTIRFVHDGKETQLKAVLNQGEKGRVLLATFVAPEPRGKNAADVTTAPPVTKRPWLPLAVSGVGAAAAITGGVLLGVGLGGVPSNCSISAGDCAGPANDPSLQKAHSSMQLANAGVAIGVTGLIVLAGGLAWYALSPSSSSGSRRGAIVSPTFTF
jgi:hypothetical protein